MKAKDVQRLKNLEEIFSCINEGVVVIQKGKICFHNEAALEISGYDSKTYMATPVSNMFYKEDGARMMERYQRRLAGEDLPHFTDARFIRFDGCVIWVSSNSSPIVWNGEPATINLFTDITERKKLEQAIAEKNEELEVMAVTDVLTNLYNRRYMEDRLKSEFDRSERYHRSLAVGMLDIDYFKKINDTYGHNIGDETLISMADILRKQIRDSDHAARWGGEEFCIVFPDTDLEDANVCLDRVREEVASSAFKGVDWEVTISGGITTLRPNDTVHSLLQRADEFLYLAKDSGRNRLYTQ